MNRPFLFLLFFLVLALPCSLSAQSTANNTSACSANGIPTAGCNGVGVMPLLGNPAHTGAQTTTLDPLPVNVSTVSVQTLVTTVGNPRPLAEIQPWFCNSSSPTCNGHVNIGMNLSLSAQALYQSQNIFSRGFKGEVIDWYGCADYCPTPESSVQHYNNEVTLAISSAIAANPSTTPTFMIMLDQGAINGTGTGQCPYASGTQSCILSALETKMDYVCATWCGQSYYEVNAKNGHPIVMLFITKTNWTTSGINWATIYSSLAAHATAGQPCTPCSGGIYPATVDFVDENAGAFGEAGMMGGFAWPQANPWNPSNTAQQFCWNDVGTPCTYNYLGGFYSAAQAQTTSVPDTITVGGIWKGFDGYNASWNPPGVMAQQCAQVLNFTVGAIATAGYSNSLPLQYVMVDTWNDYEEGTETETGVNNCYTIAQPAISGGNITWSLVKSDATYASTITISKLQIWTGTGNPTTLYADNLSPSTTSYAAPPLTGSQSAWVYMVGQPLVQNQISPPVSGPSASSTYYIATSGSDSNSGISESSPWAHLPGMATWTGSHTPVAGDTYILRGCDIWTNSNFPILWSWSGALGQLITITSNAAWYNTSNCASQWNRPIFNAGGSVMGGTECPSGSNNYHNFFLNISASYTYWSWIEAKGLYWAGTCADGGLITIQSGQDHTFDHFYVHDWSADHSTAVDIQGFVSYLGGSGACGSLSVTNCTWQYGVFDNSDGDGVSGGGTQSFNSMDSIYKAMTNAIKPYSNGEIGGNLITGITNSFDGITHENCIETIQAQGNKTYYIHDNLITGNTECEGLQVGNSGEVDYVWNNIWNSSGSGNNGPQVPQSSPSGSMFFWNNTVAGGWPYCIQNAGHGSAFTGTFWASNNHCINASAAITDGSFTAGTLTIANNVGMTPTVATSQGYTNAETYIYSPVGGCTSSTCATVSAGTNLSFNLPAGPSPSGGEFNTSDTFYAATEQTINGVVQAVAPTRTQNTRPIYNTQTLWDAGAYQLNSTSSCQPPLYCAPSTSPTAVVQLPTTLPNWTIQTGPNAGNPLYGAGVAATTNEFGTPTTITRLTDITNNCNPNIPYSSAQVANSGSSDETHVNALSPPSLAVFGASGAWSCPYALTITGGSISASRIDNNFYFPSTVNSVEPSYTTAVGQTSYSNPNTMFAQNGGTIQSYDFTGYGPTVTPPTPTTFYNFASTSDPNCLSSTQNPYPAGGTNWVDHLTSSKYPPDAAFGEAFSNAGAQNTGFDVVVYTVGSGCSHYNTKTGTITGDWGYNGSILIPDRFYVHNALITTNGVWMRITWETCITSCSAANNTIQYDWMIGTPIVLVECSPSVGDQCGGHGTRGANLVINTSGASTFQTDIRPIPGAPNPPTALKSGISSCASAGWAIHLGWGNVNSADNYPYFEISENTTKEQGTAASPFTCQFINEIDVVSSLGASSSGAGAGTVYRGPHTFNTGTATVENGCSGGATGLQDGVISTDGTWVFWTFDGMQAPGFGSTSGGTTCSGTTCRCEIAAAQLVPGSTNYTLTQTVVGSGSVSSSPSGIACPSTCSAPYAAMTSVTLTETPSAGYTFMGWTGGCSGSGSTTTVTMSASLACTATFAAVYYSFNQSISITGSGSVTSSPAGINCEPTCSGSFLSGTVLTLSETPAVGYTFTGWGGDCTGTGSTTTITMNSSHSCTATFVPLYTLTQTVFGGGAVSSSPSGISCPSTCSYPFASGTSVTLTETASGGYLFIGWSGACTGMSSTAVVVMNSNQSCTATFLPAAAVIALPGVNWYPGTRVIP